MSQVTFNHINVSINFYLTVTGKEWHLPTMEIADQGQRTGKVPGSTFGPGYCNLGGERGMCRSFPATEPNCVRRTLKSRTSAVGVEKASDDGSH